MATKLEERMVTIPAAEYIEPEVKGGKIWGTFRVFLGSIFLWAFFDKLFSLGFSTGRMENGGIDFFGPDAWINGGSPTAGFLEFGTKGPFASFFQGLAGNAWVDWAFMLGLFFIGTALILGIGTRLAAIGGVTLLMSMYLASAIWPEHHPVVDDHVMYSIGLIGLAYVGAGRYLGFGKRWEKVGFVKRHPILK